MHSQLYSQLGTRSFGCKANQDLLVRYCQTCYSRWSFKAGGLIIEGGFLIEVAIFKTNWTIYHNVIFRLEELHNVNYIVNF